MHKKDKATIEFISHSAEGVAGSCNKIEYRDKVVLVDFGLIQEGKTIYENYKFNSSFLKKIKPQKIDAIVITHLHADHCALLPYLYKEGLCSAPIYVAKNSSKIAREMLIDCATIMERDAETLTQQKEKQYDPIFTVADVEKCLPHIVEVNPFEELEISDGLTIKFIPNAHILLSQSCLMTFDTSPVKKTVYFSGDLGNIQTLDWKFYLEDFTPIEKCNYAICESTYGLPSRRNTKKDFLTDMKKMETVIRQFCLDCHGRVLIPTFSLDRMSFFMWLLYNIFKDDESFKIPILIDSPLAIRLLHCYEEILEGDKKEQYQEMMAWKNFKFIVEPDASRAAIEDKDPKVILASSGMITAGRSVYWSKSVIQRANDCFLICGFCAPGTLGSKIRDDKTNKTISICGKSYPNRAAIVNLTSFSSHMQHQDLVNYYSSIHCDKILLVHGEEDAKLALKKDVEEAIHKNMRTTKVVAVNKSTKLNIE